jgi:hypothetical protein
MKKTNTSINDEHNKNRYAFGNIIEHERNKRRTKQHVRYKAFELP